MMRFRISSCELALQPTGRPDGPTVGEGDSAVSRGSGPTGGGVAARGTARKRKWSGTVHERLTLAAVEPKARLRKKRVEKPARWARGRPTMVSRRGGATLIMLRRTPRIYTRPWSSTAKAQMRRDVKINDAFSVEGNKGRQLFPKSAQREFANPTMAPRLYRVMVIIKSSIS